MKKNVFGSALLALMFAVPALAQEQVAANVGGGNSPDAAAADTAVEETAAASSFVLRPVGQNGLNLFEAPKFTGPFDGVKVTLGGCGG